MWGVEEERPGCDGSLCAAHPSRTIGVELVAIGLGVVGTVAGLGALTTEGNGTNGRSG